MSDQDETKNEVPLEAVDLSPDGRPADPHWDPVDEGISMFDPAAMHFAIALDGLPSPIDQNPRNVEFLARTPANHVCMADRRPGRERRPCRHQARQIVPAFANAQGRQFISLCTLRRNAEGAFVDLTDRNIFACDMRDPPLPESQSMLDAWEDRVIEEDQKTWPK